MSLLRFFFIIIFLLLPQQQALFAADPTYLVIGENVRWQGEILLSQPILVAAGVQLEIAPGTVISSLARENGIRVEGALLATGTEQQPISFNAPAGWVGIELVQSAIESHFAYVNFRSAATAISSSLSRFRIEHTQFQECDIAVLLHRQSIPTIEKSSFIGNRIAVDIEMRSQAVVRNNLFRDNKTAVQASHNSGGELSGNIFLNNEQGIRLQHLFLGLITDNRFEKNTLALLCDQTMESPQIINNEFIENQQGLVSMLASMPLVKNNRFSRNQQALVNNQLGNPRIEANLFSDNQIAIVSERRSAPQIELNQFVSNELALHCDYLSYPIVRQNNFTDTRMAVRLGDHQSADMEKQGKSQQDVQSFLSESGRQGKMAVFDPVTGVVDMRDNWWGLPAGSALAPLFYDRNQSEWVVDDTSGERYLRDLVEFSPWLKQPVANAGIQNQ